MQFAFILSVIALVMTVSASPVPNPTNPPPSDTCSSSQTLACCGNQFSYVAVQCATNNALLDLGATCEASSSYQCCPNDSVNQNGLVNIGVNCVAVPITA